jgi:3-deoxy-D-manno-octulosonic-acid transferase
VLESGQSLRRFLGANRPVLIAASTRDGEEEMLLEGFSELLHAHPNLLLLIAPRHPQRFRSVVELCEQKGFAVESHQRAKSCKPDIQIYVIDSMGELPNFYAASDVAFVGGSLMPNGGHNVVEPAALGVAVIVGPHTDNFSDIVQLLSTAGALLIADDVCGFVGHVAKLLADSDARDEAGAAGRRIVEENKGASVKVAQILDEILAHSGESISGTQIGLGRIKREL